MIESNNIFKEKVENKERYITANIYLFAFVAFIASYYGNVIFGILTIICSILLLRMNRAIFLGLLIGISAFAHFFIVNLFFISVTLNSIMAILYIIYHLPKIKFVKGRNEIILFCLYILILVGVLAIPKHAGLSITWMLNIVLFITICFTSNSKLNVKIINKTLGIISLVWILLISFVIILNPFIDYTQRFSINEDINPNRLGMAITIYAVILFVTLVSNKSKFFNIVYGVSYISAIYVIFLTGSRNSLLAVSLSSIFIMLYLAIRRKKILQFFGFAIIGVIGLASLLVILQDTSVINRFTLDVLISDKGSMRYNSYPILLREIIPNNLFFGIGFGKQDEVLAMYGYGENYPAAHNIIISSITEMGLVGFIPFLYLVIISGIRLFLAEKRDNNLSLIKYIFITTLLLGIGETIYSERILWLIMALCITEKKLITILQNENQQILINEN